MPCCHNFIAYGLTFSMIYNTSMYNKINLNIRREFSDGRDEIRRKILIKTLNFCVMP